VVYNHTAEGNHLGPTLSMRGIDNHAYYRLVDDEPRHYLDFTGCGNSLNMRHPHVLQLIMDSLRHWVLDMHVDGFRFDLASALAREIFEVDRLSAFFDIIHQDPVLSQVKLIAEPWDVGEGGYQVGNFPPKWSEWNADIETPCVISGVANMLASPHSPNALQDRRTSTGQTRGGRPHRLTSSPVMTDLPSQTSSVITRNTMMTTAKRAVTESLTIGHGITALKGQPSTLQSTNFVIGSGGIWLQHCFSTKGYRCC
jgi:hypothetical protein